MGSDMKAAVDADTVFFFVLLSCATPTTYNDYNQVMNKWQIFFSPVSVMLVVAVSIFFGFCQLKLYFYYHLYTQTFLLNHMINKNMPNLEGVFVCSVIHMHTYSTHTERVQHMEHKLYLI